MDEDITIISADDFTSIGNKPPVKHRKSYFHGVDEYTLDGQYVRTWETYAAIGDAYGVSRGIISDCVKGSSLIVNKIGRIFLKEGADINERLEKIGSSHISPDRRALVVPVKEYDLKGKLITIYPSISFASSHCGHCNTVIKKVMKGKKLCTSDGRIFLRDGMDIKARLELIRQRDYNKNMDRSIDMYSYKGTPNGHFRNAAEAAEKFHVSMLSILDCCLGVTDRCKANIFLFSGDSIKERLETIKQKKK